MPIERMNPAKKLCVSCSYASDYIEKWTTQTNSESMPIDSEAGVPVPFGFGQRFSIAARDRIHADL
jgi:hypothetical protein